MKIHPIAIIIVLCCVFIMASKSEARPLESYEGCSGYAETITLILNPEFDVATNVPRISAMPGEIDVLCEGHVVKVLWTPEVQRNDGTMISMAEVSGWAMWFSGEPQFLPIGHRWIHLTYMKGNKHTINFTTLDIYGRSSIPTETLTFKVGKGI